MFDSHFTRVFKIRRSDSLTMTLANLFSSMLPESCWLVQSGLSAIVSEGTQTSRKRDSENCLLSEST